MTLSRFQTLNQRIGVPHMERHRGVSVTIKRNGVPTSAFTARRQDMRFQTLGDALGAVARVQWREYLCPLADVVIGGETTEPQAGDMLYEGTEQWEVATVSSDIPAVEQHENGNDWRVHCRKVVL